jgi:hypothetical protein
MLPDVRVDRTEPARLSGDQSNGIVLLLDFI